MSDASDAWVVAHAAKSQLILVSPGQELHLGPFANICDLERALTRLCRLASNATITTSRAEAGRAKLRFMPRPNRDRKISAARSIASVVSASASFPS